MLKKFIKKIDIGYFQIKKENDYLLEKKLINLKKIRNINEIKKYDVVVISSFEYQTEIKEKLKFVKKDKLFEIYDNSSRSLIDSYLIKNIKTKNKIFREGVKTSL